MEANEFRDIVLPAMKDPEKSATISAILHPRDMRTFIAFTTPYPRPPTKTLSTKIKEFLRRFSF